MKKKYMVALVGPFGGVGRVRGNRKYFIFDPIRIKETACDCHKTVSRLTANKLFLKDGLRRKVYLYRKGDF